MPARIASPARSTSPASAAWTSSTPNWRSTKWIPGSTSGTDFRARSMMRSIARPGATSTISAWSPSIGGDLAALRGASAQGAGRMDLEHPGQALDEVDPRLHLGHRPQGEVDDALDREGGRDLDDQRVVALHRRVAARTQRRPQVGRELPAQVRDREVDPQLDV